MRFADMCAVRYTPARVMLLSAPVGSCLYGFFANFVLRLHQKRVLSSVGRAAPLQGVGHRFDPCSTHHRKQTASLQVPQIRIAVTIENPHTSPWRVFCFCGGCFVRIVCAQSLRGAGPDEIGRANHSHLRYYYGLVPACRRRLSVRVVSGRPEKSMPSGSCTPADSCLVFNAVGIHLPGLHTVYARAPAWPFLRFMQRSSAPSS